MNGPISPSRERWPSGKIRVDKVPRATSSADCAMARRSLRRLSFVWAIKGRRPRRMSSEIRGMPRA